MMEADDQRVEILLIDDDEFSNLATRRAIESFNVQYFIHTVEDGKEGKEHLLSNPDTLPDIILLDITMPVMDGFQFLEWIDSSDFKGKTKIIMFTASSSEEDKAIASKYQDVVGFITKPITRTKWEECVWKFNL